MNVENEGTSDWQARAEKVERELERVRKQAAALVEEISKASNLSDLTQLPAVDRTIGEPYLVGVRRGLIIAENIAHTHARTLGL